MLDVELIIGNNAGIVWDSLECVGENTAIRIAKNTKLKLNDVYAALGWLGREGKIIAFKKNSRVIYRLNV